MTIDVSVVIPTYNRLWALPTAVASCREERSTEIIVIDDGSTDGTWDWLQKQKGITALRQENWGKDWAVNRGLALASGEFVRFLDSDDWLIPGSTDQQVSIGRSQNADIVVSGYSEYYEESKTQRAFPWTDCDDFIAQQLGECFNSHYSAYLFRKRFIECTPHRAEFGPLDDRMFIIEVAINDPQVAVYSPPTFVHRHHTRGRLQFAKGMDAIIANWQLLSVYRRALAILAARGKLTERRIRAVTNALWPLAHRIAFTDIDEGCEVAELVFSLDSKFVPPQTNLAGHLYRRLGFRKTEQLRRLRRLFRHILKI
jgi:glycosyltransferase involved in cell wall biosynthesis